MYENDFQVRMQAGKDRAARDRDNGGSSVRVYATTNAMLHALGRVEHDNFDLWLAQVQARVSDILESTRQTYMTEQDWRDGL